MVIIGFVDGKLDCREDHYEFDFSGGALCLDFANTIPDRPCCEKEHLTSFSRLLTWAEQAGIVGEEARDSLRHAADEAPAEMERVLEEATELRECLYRIFSTLADGACVTAPDLEVLNRWVKKAFSELKVREGDCGFEWAYPPVRNLLDYFLHPVARSAAELLTSEDLPLVRECGSEACSWLFLDRSRTKRRRWCDMKTCGNRAKARRHYARSRAGHPET
ncbi:MAG: ABATE domain-containing protein [Acidobacteriota bacterium]|nr:MAG: ABATE domain-containing protein [Acidobacteriota bacterium]